ncbi:MAG: hypothetical protein WCP68_12690, partial [Enhydrobacter sp.]
MMRFQPVVAAPVALALSLALTLAACSGPSKEEKAVATYCPSPFVVQDATSLTRFKPGQLYDNRLTDDLRAALVATGLFATVSVEPVRTGNINPDGTDMAGA